MAASPTPTPAPPVREPAWPLSRAARTLWLTEGLIGAVPVLIATALVWALVPADADTPRVLVRLLVAVAAALYVVAMVVVRPWFRFRVHRWEVTDDAVYTLTGWLTRTWTLVPISRIQTVDVTRGVLQQLFGLASVAVMTASSQGTVRVLHLEHDVAQRVADDLAHRAEQVRDTAT